MVCSKIEFVPTAPRLFPGAMSVLRKPLYSHRSGAFGHLYEETQAQLAVLAGTTEFRSVLFSGNGTLANDILVHSYAARYAKPLVLVNGEFGRRLYEQCRIANPAAEQFDFGYGVPFDPEKIRSSVASRKADLLLAVVCETSTGMMNAISSVTDCGVPVLLDAVSSFGYCNDCFQHSSVLAVSASSGKALAGMPGIAIVLYRPDSLPDAPSRIPVSLDLGSIAAAQTQIGCVRNTLNSTLLESLSFSLSQLIENDGVQGYRTRLLSLKHLLVEGLLPYGVTPFPGSDSAAVTAFSRPRNWSDCLAAFRSCEIEVYHAPVYLEKHAVFEVATFGDFTRGHVGRLLAAFALAESAASGAFPSRNTDGIARAATLERVL